MAGMDDSILVPQDGALAEDLIANLGGDLVAIPYEKMVHPVHGLYWRFKRPIGFVLAFVMAVLFLPVMVMIALVLSYQGRPILIRRRRLGCRGQSFNSYWFRTMVPDSLKGLAPGGDGRPVIDAFGQFLLHTRLDQAPLIWNVLRGDMNLVGPRPLSLEEFYGSGRAVQRSLSVRPGITGLWWLEGHLKARRRLASDRTYIEHASPLMDLQILLRTILLMHRGSASRAASAGVKTL